MWKEGGGRGKDSSKWMEEMEKMCKRGRCGVVNKKENRNLKSKEHNKTQPNITLKIKIRHITSPQYHCRGPHLCIADSIDGSLQHACPKDIGSLKDTQEPHPDDVCLSHHHRHHP